MSLPEIVAYVLIWVTGSIITTSFVGSIEPSERKITKPRSVRFFIVFLGPLSCMVGCILFIVVVLAAILANTFNDLKKIVSNV